MFDKVSIFKVKHLTKNKQKKDKNVKFKENIFSFYKINLQRFNISKLNDIFYLTIKWGIYTKFIYFLQLFSPIFGKVYC